MSSLSLSVRRASRRKASQAKAEPTSMNPDDNPNVLDGPQALRASPDADGLDERLNLEHAGLIIEKQVKEETEDAPLLISSDEYDSPLSELSYVESPVKATNSKIRSTSGMRVKSEGGAGSHKKIAQAAKPRSDPARDHQFLDPEAEGDEEADEEEIQAALSRPPPVNSDYLPLPWKGRLGYACLNTYLRFSNPPVFSSRTCRIASILENRHPLKEPNEPPHATKNRPDRDQPASVERGQAFVESLGLANARDIVKMLKWNDRYGIKFLRLSSEMFPFASHEEYGYRLAPFAAGVLAEAGKVAAELGHRLTTHPGQFTQLGSPRNQVILNAIRDLDYHAELLSLLKLPPQQNRDAVMILHLGGVFGDKSATLDRFRENYKGLSQNIKDRLVLENDDVSWSVHDLLPLCEELNIPMVLDFHHHNIIFDSQQIREGTKDITQLYPRILATWKRKNITPKMHYSEPIPSAITGMQRRKHSPRVATLPPCPPQMDLMIEAKDKEQAVFELMRTFRLPGFDSFNDIIPHVRKDDNKPVKLAKKETPRKKAKKAQARDEDLEMVDEIMNAEEDRVQAEIADEDVGMGGPDGRVYWPPSMEHWLRPVKKVLKPKNPGRLDEKEKATPAKKRKAGADPTEAMAKLEDEARQNTDPIAAAAPPTPAKRSKTMTKANAKKAAPLKKAAKSVLAPSASDHEMFDPYLDGSKEPTPILAPVKPPVRKSARAKKISHATNKEL